MNHNSLYFVFASILSISLCSHNLVTYKIDSVLSLVNSNMIEKCISTSSIIEYYAYGIYYLELDTNKVKEKVNNTINNNLTFTTNNIYYYFYDCFILNGLKDDDYKNNSVQIKIEITYLNKTVYKEVNYQLTNINT